MTFCNFRNYTALHLEPAAGLNVFVGANAQGKSNLLEGIAVLGTGKSFRTARDADTIRKGYERATLHGAATLGLARVELACSIERTNRGTRKQYAVNGRNVRYAGYLGQLRVVTFVPADLQLASGTPSARRAFLNIALAQSEPRYYYELARYRKAVQQKNAVLRGAVSPDPELLETYNRTMVQSGTEIMLARARFVGALAGEAQRAHERFAPKERLGLAYEPNVVFENANRETVATALAERLAQCTGAEQVRKSSVAGPHRDDINLSLDGLPLATYGSQGQQRTAVLALKLAEHVVLRERGGEAPLLLLDDVLSELDEERAAAFLREIAEYEQAFITATHLPPRLCATAHLSRIADAQVKACAPC